MGPHRDFNYIFSSSESQFLFTAQTQTDNLKAACWWPLIKMCLTSDAIKHLVPPEPNPSVWTLLNHLMPLKRQASGIQRQWKSVWKQFFLENQCSQTWNMIVFYPSPFLTSNVMGFLFTTNGNVWLRTFPCTLQLVSPHINVRHGLGCHGGNE